MAEAGSVRARSVELMRRRKGGRAANKSSTEPFNIKYSTWLDNPESGAVSRTKQSLARDVAMSKTAGLE